jgi:peptidoglycan/LPS O-acetylase OafA/YrhL
VLSGQARWIYVKSGLLVEGSLRKMDALTSLRFFAAIGIVIEHTKDAFHSTAWINSAIPFDYGVSFFFVLSGFILSYNYREFGNVMVSRQFYVARLARIWPLHVVAFLINMALIPTSIRFVGGDTTHWIRITLANLLLVQAWLPKVGYFFSLNAVSWSVSTEMFFYLMFPLLRNNWSKTWHWKTLLVLFISCSILTIATARNLPPIDLHAPMRISSAGIAYISPFTRITEFLLGMIFGGIFIRYQNAVSGNVWVWTVIELASIMLIPFFQVYTSEFPSVIAGHDLSASAWGGFAVHSGGAPAFAVITLVMAFGRGLISRALCLRPLVLLGEVSFALYLVHQSLIGYFYLNRPRFEGIPDSVLCGGYWVFTIAASFALWVFVEKPCRKWIRRIFNAERRNKINSSLAS